LIFIFNLISRISYLFYNEKIFLNELNLFLTLFLFHLSNLQAQTAGLLATKNSPHVKLKNVNIGDVIWTDGFWAERVKQSREIMIPYMREIYMKRALKNFKIAAEMEQGSFLGSWWHDGDFYKWVEALTMSYADTKSKETEKQLDEIIAILAKAQEQDGYINTAIQIGQGHLSINFTDERKYTNNARWQSEKEHELYNLGHLFTLAALHHRITGKMSLLNVATKSADYLDAYFKNPTPELASLSFNPPQIMGLVELYRETHDKKYLQLANKFLEMKGMMKEKRHQTQDHLPVHKATEAVGHAVTGAYLYSGMADVFAETGDTTLIRVLNKLWEDITFKKMYITGGIGSYHNGGIGNEGLHEAFGAAYDLPNATAYNETCANISNGMFNYRMLSLTGDVKHADVMEQVFYNSLLSSIGLEGKSFFYTNVLRWHGQEHKLLSQDSHQRWNLPRGGICCPPNTVRTIAEMSNYAYSVSDKGLWVNLYGSNTLKTTLPDGTAVQFAQVTSYPWDEEVKLTYQESKKKDFALMLRIPEWAVGATLKMNGKAVGQLLTAGKYFELHRKWVKGDVVELHLPMKVQLVEANPLVEENINQVAVKRGPVVYCLESLDLPNNVKLGNIAIPQNIELEPVYKKGFLGGVMVLQGKALSKDHSPSWRKTLYQESKTSQLKIIDVQLIPYYSWNNRGISEMAVWLPVSR